MNEFIPYIVGAVVIVILARMGIKIPGLPVAPSTPVAPLATATPALAPTAIVVPQSGSGLAAPDPTDDLLKQVVQAKIKQGQATVPDEKFSLLRELLKDNQSAPDHQKV